MMIAWRVTKLNLIRRILGQTVIAAITNRAKNFHRGMKNCLFMHYLLLNFSVLKFEVAGANFRKYLSFKKMGIS